MCGMWCAHSALIDCYNFWHFYRCTEYTNKLSPTPLCCIESWKLACTLGTLIAMKKKKKKKSPGGGGGGAQMQEEEVHLLRAYQIELRILQEKDELRIHWIHVCSCIAMHSRQPLHCRQQPQNPPGISLQITTWANLLARGQSVCQQAERERERKLEKDQLHTYICRSSAIWSIIITELPSTQIFCFQVLKSFAQWERERGRERERSCFRTWSTTLDLSLLQLIGPEDPLTRWSVANTRGMLRVED